MKKMQTTIVRCGVLLLFFSGCVTSFIVPEELPTILSLIYSNIPPIKKGTDSRLGVGFRLGEHADFQVLVELGPQRDTDPIGIANTQRRREATLDAAMKGDLGPWAQSIAKYQMQMRIQKELEAQLRLEEKLKKLQINESQNDATSGGGEWLTKWSKGMIEPPGQQSSDETLPIEGILPSMVSAKKISTSGSLQTLKSYDMNNKMKELQKLYKPQPIAQNL